jgi:hypothetical protein
MALIAAAILVTNRTADSMSYGTAWMVKGQMALAAADILVTN